MDLLLEATYDVERRHFWFHGFRRFIEPLIELGAAGRRDLRILDCGCGTGRNLEWLSAYGQASGFDLTWRGLEFARRHGATRIAQASITHIPFRTASFDLVTSFDVMQSLSADQERETMREFARILAPGGALVLNVAAMEILRGDHSVLAEELRRYSTSMMRAAVAGAGLHLERVTYTNGSLFPAVFIQRTWQRWRGLPATAHTRALTMPPRVVNSALKGLLAAEAALVRHVDLPAGSSLMCLARRV
jgi:ubiquinone/menaquinone biosynthesis C-methylase UbiE